jgi:hypothetical protein
MEKIISGCNSYGITEELQEWAMSKVYQKRVVIKKLSNDKLKALEWACVKVGRFLLCNRITNEMLARPDFIPERGSNLEKSLINCLPNGWLFEREPLLGPYIYDYLTYKEGRNPAAIAHKKFQEDYNKKLNGLTLEQFCEKYNTTPHEIRTYGWPQVSEP